MTHTNAAQKLDLLPAYERVALVDLSCRFKQIYHSGEPGTAADRTLAELASINAEVDHMIVCIDSPPYGRAGLYAQYKANREEPSPEEIYQRKKLRRELKARGYPLALAEGYEADDVIATLARHYALWCPEVLILGGDKDLAQCIGAHVLQITPASGERQAARRGVEECRQKFGVYPEHMRLWQALRGDKSDNIPGVKGIGDIKATTIVEQLIDGGYATTPQGFTDMVAYAPKLDPIWSKVTEAWADFVLSYQLVTLATDVPLDVEGLLVKPSPISTAPESHMPEAPANNSHPEPAPSPVQQEINRLAAEGHARIAAGITDPATGKLHKTAANEVTEAVFDPIGPSPGANGPLPPKPEPEPKPEPKPEPTTALAKAWGTVDDKLQPTDLQSAWQISKMLAAGGLYRNFDTAEAVFSVIQRGRELGLDAGTALQGFHLIEGKPVASADLIRSLAERDPNCEYFMLVEATSEKATWETKHKRHPRPTRYTYTIEQARMNPELFRKDKWGKEGNWVRRAQEMLTKTAGSKLSRIVYPGACLGLYCPEEMDGQ
jgi:5'-3' exonuclease